MPGLPLPLIPVLDLRRGEVVRAVRGDRARYAPVRSKLVATAEPLDVARALLRAAGDARRLYIADLDAILEGAAQTEVLRALRQALPAVELWLDAGFADAAAARRLIAALAPAAGRAPVVPVFGSESIADLAALEGLGRDWPDALLSLDSRGGEALDPAGCRLHPQHWPRRVIVMTLDRVGSAQGPDLSQLQRVAARAGGRGLIGAGGVRGPHDLQAAAQAGASAWLVASALHDGHIGAA